MTKQFAVVGLGTMGASLARNAMSRGFEVFVYNRTYAKTERFMESYASEGTVSAFEDLAAMINAMERPRTIFLLVKAGAAVAAFIDRLVPLLAPGDIVCDGGNSLFRNSISNGEKLASAGMHFLGVGVSGGELGALRGPSMMIGGPDEAWAHVGPILTAMGAPDGLGGKCVGHFSSGYGAGHYVKMVHNGIEYGVMQVVAEAYSMLRKTMDRDAASAVFADWAADHDSPLDSYLIELAAAVLSKSDHPTVDDILDQAKGKGTGLWTTQQSLELETPTPIISAALSARQMSSSLSQREAFTSYALDQSISIDLSDLKQAVEFAAVVSYLQGLFLIKRASDEHAWNINLREVTRTWRGGCIIRARTLLAQLGDLTGDSGTDLILEGEAMRFLSKEHRQSAARVASAALLGHIPIPALTGAIAWVDSLSAPHLSANMIQSLRDAFGAHTVMLLDGTGPLHLEWDLSTITS